MWRESLLCVYGRRPQIILLFRFIARNGGEKSSTCAPTLQKAPLLVLLRQTARTVRSKEKRSLVREGRQELDDLGILHPRKFIMGGSDEEKFDHPTQKPVELMRKPILNHTKPGELVYDPFWAAAPHSQPLRR